MRFIVSISGNSMSGTEAQKLVGDNVFGVILYGKNILGYQSTKKLIRSIKALRSNLQVCVDEEGGIVSRFQHLIPNLSQPYLGRDRVNKKEIRKYYHDRSEFLVDLGVDFNFAPLVDVAPNETSVMYKRSYSPDIERVIEVAEICLNEQKKSGLKSCIKHFPGHGFSSIDSHQVLPVVGLTKTEWQNKEGRVFRKLIAKGVDGVMVGHLKYPKIHNSISSMSVYWINQVLRKELDYQGLVIIDDICMKAIKADSFLKLRSNLLADVVIMSEDIPGVLS